LSRMISNHRTADMNRAIKNIKNSLRLFGLLKNLLNMFRYLRYFTLEKSGMNYDFLLLM
jgi:hypothetical protein